MKYILCLLLTLCLLLPCYGAAEFDGTTDKLAGSDPVASMPLSIFAYVNKSTTNTFMYCVTVTDTTGDEFWGIAFAGNSTVRAMSRDAGVIRQATSGTNYSADTWYPTLGEFSGTSAREIQYNGGNSADNTDFSNPTSISEITVGWRNGTGPSSLEGKIAEICVWDTTLTPAQEALLWAGVQPNLVARDNVVFYHRLRDTDTVTTPQIGATLTESGTVTLISDHPSTYVPPPYAPATNFAGGLHSMNRMR